MPYAEIQMFPEWMKQLDKYTKKCGFTSEEKMFIAKLSKKYNVPPERIIATIALNSTKVDKEWEITLHTSLSYGYAIDALKEELQKVKKNLEHVKKDKSFVGKVKTFFGERDEKYLIKKIARYELIGKILGEVSDKKNLIKKICEKSGIEKMNP